MTDDVIAVQTGSGSELGVHPLAAADGVQREVLETPESHSKRHFGVTELNIASLGGRARRPATNHHCAA